MTSRVLRISPDLSFPTDVVTSTTVVYGGKGMGKTNFGSVLVEELAKAGLRFCLLDPMGVAWGLRHSSDGKGPGITCVILGGAHGDIPIEPTGGSVVADFVIDEGVNTIIDFSRHPNGKMWSNGERVRFVTDYAIRLFERQGSLVEGRRREPLLQILDEAARYIPQAIPSGAIDLARCVGAWEQICEEGRNIGLGVAFLTQRSARMAKSVSELADVMLAFRTIGPNSLDAVLDWLGNHVEKSKIRDLAAQVRELDIGQALIVSPGWLKVERIAKIRARETFDSSATPRAGQKPVRVTGSGAKPDLGKYRERMAATIERAAANDPKMLKAKVADLEKRLAQAAKSSAPPDPKAIDRAIDLALAARDKADRTAMASVVRMSREIVRLVDTVGVNLSTIQDRARDVEKAVDEKVLAVLDAKSLPPMPSGPGKPETRGTFTPRPAPPARGRPYAPAVASGDIQGDGSIPSGERKIMVAIAQNDGADREQLTVLTGYKKSSRDAYIQRLQSKGFLAQDGRLLQLTQEGMNALGEYERLPTGDRLREYWLNRLPEGESKILTVICHAYPRSIDRDSIDVGYQKSSRDAYIQRLAAKKLVTADRGTVTASANLFD